MSDGPASADECDRGRLPHGQPFAPYTLGTRVYQGLKAYLKPAVQNGRYGSAQWLKWTHLLFVAPTLDLRDAYNSQLDPARDNTKADTVILYDTQVLTTKTAFYVAFVEQRQPRHASRLPARLPGPLRP